MDYRKKWKLEEENQKLRDAEFAKLLKKTPEYDRELPDFFSNAAELFVDSLEREGNQADEDGCYHFDGLDYLHFVHENWFIILENKYKKFLQTAPIEDINYIDYLTKYFFMGAYLHGIPGINKIDEMSFEAIFRNLEPQFDKYFEYECKTSEDYDSEEERRYRIREEIGNPCDIPTDENYIYKRILNIGDFNYFEIGFDYYKKGKTVFYVITNPEIIHINKGKLVSYYICLTERIINNNEYYCDGNIIKLNEKSLFQKQQDFYGMQDIYNDAFSCRTCFIYFFNYNENRNEDNFNKLARMTCLSIMRLCKNDIEIKSYSTLELAELLNKMFECVNSFFEECKKSNKYNMHINCLPKDSTDWLGTFYLKAEGGRRTSEFAIDEVSKYVEFPTIFETECVKLVKRMRDAGYERTDTDSYVEAYLKNSDQRDEILDIYQNLYNLALANEIIFFLCDAISINKTPFPDMPNFKRLYIHIHDYVYEDREYEIIENELEMIDSRSMENDNKGTKLEIHRQILYMLNAELDAEKNLTEIFDLRKGLINLLYDSGIDDLTKNVVVEINEKIIDIIGERVHREKLYEEIALKVRKGFEKYTSIIYDKLRNYMGDISEFTENIERVIRVISTAEYLYDIYVEPYTGKKIDSLPQSVREMDFSCIALEYYTALELLSNLIHTG